MMVMMLTLGTWESVQNTRSVLAHSALTVASPSTTTAATTVPDILVTTCGEISQKYSGFSKNVHYIFQKYFGCLYVAVVPPWQQQRLYL